MRTLGSSRADASMLGFADSPQPTMRLDHPRPLQCLISIHQVDAEPLRLGIDQQRPVRRESLERIASGLLVQMSARNFEWRIDAIERLCRQLTDHAFAQ